jgi:ribosomal protein S18 acetylase RimI-like enzyme
LNFAFWARPTRQCSSWSGSPRGAVRPPGQPAELWINEVGVAPTHLRRSLAQTLLRLLFDCGRALGGGQAWVLTDRDNAAAMRLYASAGGDPGEREHVMCEFKL